MKIEYLGFLPTIIFIFFVTGLIVGKRNLIEATLEGFSIWFVFLTVSGIIIAGLLWAMGGFK